MPRVTQVRDLLYDAFAKPKYAGRLSLIDPTLPGEFNRCLLHSALNEELRLGRITSWSTSAYVCRVADTPRVLTKEYSTLFEMFAAVDLVAPRDAGAAFHELLSDTVQALCATGLKKQNLIIQYFAGELPFTNTDIAALDIASPWLEAGLSKEQLRPIYGPKLFFLFLGDQERAGEKCEIIYAQSGSQREIGSIILDRFLLQRNRDNYDLLDAPSHGVGLALGLERLMAAVTQAPHLWGVEPLASLRTVAEQHAKPANHLLEEDLLLLADQVRGALHLLPERERIEAQPSRERLFRTMVNRIRRKCAILRVESPTNLITEMAGALASHDTVPNLSEMARELGVLVNSTTIEEAWNPSSYRQH